MNHRIDMRPVWAGGRAGYRYDLSYDGRLVVERTSQPLCDAARWLQDAGKDGKVELWRYGGSGPCLTSEISRYAPLFLSEPNIGPMRYRKRQPDPSIHDAGEALADE
jgi:hypothetical protein